MNYNALLLLDKHHNHKINSSTNNSNINQFSFFNHKNKCSINIHIKDNQKYNKCYSVKPSSYMMPKDIILKDIFQNAIRTSNEYIKKYDINISYNFNNNNNLDRKYIFEKIKKFIFINHINYNIFGKTIYLYDLLFFLKEKSLSKIKNVTYFYNLPNLSIALIAFILVLKFNKEENKMISLKKFIKNFEERDERIKFNEVCEMEIIALQIINYNLTFQTPFSFMELFLINGIIFNEDCIHSDLSFNIYELVNETLENIMESSNEYFKYNYFYLCCCVIMYVREKFKISRWPRALEITFDVNYSQFSDIYNIFFIKKNKNNNNNNNSSNKNNIKSFYNADIINIGNLKSMSNILSVLKIMKSADKYRKNKDKINKIDLFNNKNNEEEKCEDKNNNNNLININSSNKIKVGLKKRWNFTSFKSPEKPIGNKTSITSILTKLNEENKNLFSNLYGKNTETTAGKENENTNTNNKNIKTENKNIVISNFEIQEEEKIEIRGKTMITNIFNTNNNKEEEIEEIKETKEIKEIKSYDTNSNINMHYRKNKYNIHLKNKIGITKSCNRYKKEIKINDNANENGHDDNNDKSQENNNFTLTKKNDTINNENNKNNNSNNSNIENYNKNTVNISIYKKRNYINRKTNNLKSYPDKNNTNNLNNSNINSNNLIKTKNYNNRIGNRYYNNYTEKKRNFELNNVSNVSTEKNNLNINQTSFNDFLFFKNRRNKNNDTNNENYLNSYKIKNKEENSNAPTCESSNVKLSLNDFSIRKSYRLKKKLTKNEVREEKLNFSPKNEKNAKFEKEGRKLLEKNKSYNKLLTTKLSFSDNTFNRKTGVRKFYKQKNLLENH